MVKISSLQFSSTVQSLQSCIGFLRDVQDTVLEKCTVLENLGNRRVKYVYNANDLKDNKLKNRVDTRSILVMTRYEKLKSGEDVDVLMSNDGERLRELPIKHTMTADLTVLIVLTLLTIGCFVNYLV